MLSPTPKFSEPQTHPAVRPWGFVGWAIAFAAFAIGFWQFPLRAVGPEFDHLPGDLVDARFNNYILEHGYRYLNGRDPTFWDVGMFYPAPKLVAYSDAHIGTLPIYATARVAGLGPERAYQVWFLVPFALNYLAAVLAARRLNVSAFTATVAAYLFAFGVMQVTSLSIHSQLNPRFLIPFAVVFVWEWLHRPTQLKLAAVLACLIGQAYLTMYMGYFLGIVLVFQTLTAFVIERRVLPWRAIFRPGWRVWAMRAVLGFAATAAAAPLLLPYIQTSKDHEIPGPGDVRGTHPTPHSWVYPSRNSIHEPWANEVFPAPDPMPAVCEKQLFAGCLPVPALLGGLAAIAFRPAFRRGFRPVAALTVLFSLLLVTNFYGVTPYEPVLYLPGAGGMRTIARIVHVLAFPWGILLGEGLEALVRRCGRFMKLAVFLMLGALIADQWVVSPDTPRRGGWAIMRFPVAEAQSRRDDLIAAIRTHPNPRAVYVFPAENDDSWPPPEIVVQLDAMAASQSLGVPTVNGWSGYPPWGWKFFADYESLFAWLTAKQHAPAAVIDGLVVIGEPANPAKSERETDLRAKFPPQPRPR